MTKDRVRLLLFTCLILPLTVRGEPNWPQFRGPRGDGVSDAKRLPVQFGEHQNVTWKTAIHGRAWSSPVIWGEQVWLTTATTNAKELSVICLDKTTGRIVRDQKLFDVEKPQYVHPFNSAASPTPVIEEGRIYVTFGAPGTACVDTQTGKVLWERRDIECNHFRGAGSSPILFGDLLIVNFDGSDFQFVVALDKKTGKTIWKHDRTMDYQDLGPNGKPQMDGDYRKAFATCQVFDFEGKPLLISQGSKAVYGYDPKTGEDIWRVEERTSYSGSTRPIYDGKLLFVPSGFASGQLLAIVPGRKGEVVDAKDAGATNGHLRVAWRVKKGVPKKPSLLLYNGLLFGLEDTGTVSCWEPASGEVVWSEKIGGHFSASPLGAGGRIYCLSEEGKVVVVAASRQFQKIAENEFGNGFMASPAVSGEALFLRTEKDLYRIEENGTAK
jgi:outer membrane protein assembly factor BamB